MIIVLKLLIYFSNISTNDVQAFQSMHDLHYLYWSQARNFRIAYKKKQKNIF